MDDQKPLLFGLASAALSIGLTVWLFGAFFPFWGYILVGLGALGVGVTSYKKDKITEHIYQQMQKDSATPEDDKNPNKEAFFSTGYLIFLILGMIVAALVAVFMYGP